MALILSATNYGRTETVNGEKVYRYRPWVAVLIFIPFILVAIFTTTASDVTLYLSSYRAIPISLGGAWNYFVQTESKGFALFNVLTHTVFFGNVTLYRLAVALVQSIPLIIILRKYSTNYLLSIFLFLAGGYFHAWMLNGLRQFMAVAIIFAATPWIIEKKYFRSIIVILLAATFHRSALYMIPVIFIAQGRIWDYKTLILIIVSAFAISLFAQNTELFNDFADVVGFSTDALDEWGDNGANPIRALVAAVPAVLSLFYRWQLREENNPLINFLVNVSVVTVTMNLFASFTSGILTGRMAVYTDVYNLILLPYMLWRIPEIRSRRFMHFACVGFYFLYFLFEAGTLHL